MTPEALDATRKASACWIDLGEGPQLVWHAWHDDALWLVTGGQEQEIARSRDDAEVTIRTRTGDVITWSGEASAVAPDAPEWPSAVALLHEKRCNAPDGEDQPLRWARESVVLRIVPGSR